jgi:hypothetical protein
VRKVMPIAGPYRINTTKPRVRPAEEADDSAQAGAKNSNVMPSGSRKLKPEP